MNRTVTCISAMFVVAMSISGGCCCHPPSRPAPDCCLPPEDSAGRLIIEYHLARAAKVSINIYDTSGRVVRELMHAAPRKAGCNYDYWDGRDSDGTPVPPGSYSWKLLGTQGLHAEYLMTLGSNYAVDTARWNARAPGNHGGPTAVAADAYGVYIAASSVEQAYGTYMVKVSRDGAARFWDAGAEAVTGDGGIAVGRGASSVFVLGNGTGGRGDKIWSYDAGTGTNGSKTGPHRRTYGIQMVFGWAGCSNTRI